MDNRKFKLIISAFYSLVAVFYALPLLLKINWYGVRDWELFTCIAAIPAASVMKFGEFPFWNPYMGGGNILFHHPEVAVISPFFLLYLVFGAVVGLKLQVFLCYFIGLLGSFRLGKRLSLSTEGAVLFSVAYFGSVYFALHFAEGHIPFTHFAFLPWFLYYLLDKTNSYRPKILAAFVLCLMILGNGAAIPLLYTLLFTGMLMLFRSIQSRSLTEMYTFLLATLGGIGLSAVKFVPMTIYLLQNKWAGQPDESIPITALSSIFFSFQQNLFAKNFDGQVWAWQEYGAYISPLLVVAALVAVAFKRSKLWPWYLLALFFLLLGLGDFGQLSPWALLTKLPGFSSARCTGRSFQFFILSIAFLGAVGFDCLRTKFDGSSLKQYILRTCMLIVIVTNFILVWPIMSSAMNRPPKEIQLSYSFTQQIGSAGTVYENFLRNRGSLLTPWLSAYHSSRGIVGPDSTVYSEYIMSGQLSITKRRYTPNSIEYEGDASQPGEIVFGMGYDPGWSVADGRELSSRNDLLSLRFESGYQQFLLSYRTPYFYTGLLISLLFLILILIIWFRRSGTEIVQSEL